MDLPAKCGLNSDHDHEYFYCISMCGLISESDIDCDIKPEMDLPAKCGLNSDHLS